MYSACWWLGEYGKIVSLERALNELVAVVAVVEQLQWWKEEIQGWENLLLLLLQLLFVVVAAVKL